MADDLRTMVREFRASVSADLAATHERVTELGRQMAELSDEVRTRITTSETAILNSIRNLRRDLDHRVGRLEERVDRNDARLEGLEGDA